MFSDCSFLEELPDISKRNTENVTSIYCMFYECSKLRRIPDISNWKTNNITNMSYLFRECPSLYSLPDLSKWNTDKLKECKKMVDSRLEKDLPTKFKKGCIIF